MKGTMAAVAAAGRPVRDGKRAGEEASLESDVDGGASSSSSRNNSNKRQRAEEEKVKVTDPEDSGSSSACSMAAVKREQVDGDVMVTETSDAGASSSSSNNSNKRQRSSSSQQAEAHQQVKAIARAAGGLPDACLGPGPAWSLGEACARSSARMQKDAAQEDLPNHYRIPVNLAAGQLRQALSCSWEMDVRIVVDDGAMIGGHRAVLCLSCEGFRAMFESGMREDEEGVVRMAGVGSSAVKALLEWVYLGRAGEECEKADGRELWVLAEMYDVPGVREWLRGEGLDLGNFCAACEFGLVPEGDRRELVEACEGIAQGGLRGVTGESGGLAGVGVAVMSRLLRAVGGGEGTIKGRGKIRVCFNFLNEWWKANRAGGQGIEPSRADIDGLLGLLDLSKLGGGWLRDVVKPSGLVGAERMIEIYEEKFVRAGTEEGGEDLSLTRVVGSSAIAAVLTDYTGVFFLAVHGRGADQRVAFATSAGYFSHEYSRVHILNVQTGEIDVSIKPREWLVFESDFGGVAFNKGGDLFVSCRTRIDVYDRAGTFVRSIGGPGSNGGEFDLVNGIAFTREGDLVVADNCLEGKPIHIMREDGTHVRSFGSNGKGEGQFGSIYGVAVGHDDSIAVADYDNACVHVFDMEGRHVRSIGGQGGGEGRLKQPVYVAIGTEGEVIVSDFQHKRVLVFSKEGKYLQSVKRGAGAVESLKVPTGVAVDEDGVLYVADTDDSNAPPYGPGRGIRMYRYTSA